MGKVKSAIITALLVAAIIVLALFATISCDVPKSNGTKRYNSFISSIPLGSELTGDASTIFYADGVLTEEEYNRDVANENKLEEYAEKYAYVEEVGLYVEQDKLEKDDNGKFVIGEEFAASVKEDAEILSDRFSEKGYLSYSVAVVDKCGIKVSVPTTFTYAAYKGHDSSTYNAAMDKIQDTIEYLTYNGGLDLRNSTTFEGSQTLVLKYDFNSFFKNAKSMTRSGNYVIRINLTNEGHEKLSEILKGATSATLYVGETPLIDFSDLCGSELSEKSLYFTTSNSDYAENCAIIINSVAHGSMLANKYNIESNSLIPSTPVYGEHAAICLAALVLFIILVAAIAPVIKYKKLGFVNALMVLAYSVAMATAIMLTGVELTIGGVFTALLGLALLSFSNFFTFEAVRRESALGRTIGSSVKLGYKKAMFGVLDVHVILLIASVLMTLIGVGELAACGLIFLIGTLASYVLYWLTRFMWYVLSSPARNKFAFCGFVREVEDDE